MSETQHGIAGAYYSSNGEQYQPAMECMCGWSTGRQFNWEDAGVMFDEHLKTVSPEAQAK